MNSIMNFSISLPLVLVLNELICMIVEGTRLTAVSNSPHATAFYFQLRNEENPSELDPALADAHARKRICKDITRSGFYKFRERYPVRMSDVFMELQEPRYSDIFQRIYTPNEFRRYNPLNRLRYFYTYSNPYSEMEFKVDAILHGVAAEVLVKEQVFTCILRDKPTRNLVAYYVSKEYNTLGDPYTAARFVFQKTLDDNPSYARYWFTSIDMAEEAAKIYERPGYNVELNYLQIRRNREPAESNDLDPLCKLLPRRLMNNQHYRFCVAVFRSAYFIDKAAYPPSSVRQCEVLQVSFKTDEAIRRTAGRSYFERMTKCSSTALDSRNEFSIYISRAYRNNRLFVYRRNHSDGRIYLENISINISILDYSHLDDVED